MGIVQNPANRSDEEPDGQPVDEFQVATYHAPPNQELAEPGDVTITRESNSVKIKWSGVHGAVSYNIHVLLSDGESQAFTVPAPGDEVTVPDVAPGDDVIARVAAVRADSEPGPPRESVLKGVPGDQPAPETPGETPS